MKNVLLMTLMAPAIFMIAGCEQFTTSYQRVDDSEFRLLDFIYEPADASPGETITLTAVFAGKKVNLEEHIDWWISFNVMRDNLFGATTVIDSIPLKKVATGTRINANLPDWPNAQAIQFTIPIPKDIIRNNKSIPERWTDILPPSVSGVIPPEFAEMTKTQLLDSLESFLENPTGSTGGGGEGGSGGGGGDNPLSQNIDYLPRLLQFFSVPIRVTAKIAKEQGKPGPHTIRSNQNIRYNSLLRYTAGIKSVPINHNPGIDNIVVYKVAGKNILSFNNKSDRKYTTTRLERYMYCGDTCDNVIYVEDGYTYFLEASTSGSLDYTRTMSDSLVEEIHHADWQFQLDSKEANGVHHSAYMDIGGNMGGLARLTPPSNKRIKKFTLWVTVTEEVINELNRPEASMLAEVSGRFEYK